MRISGWRIVKARHAAAAFTGEGAELSGGQWNSPGTRMVYTAGSASLAMLEMLVHLQLQEFLNRYVLFEVTFDSSLIETIHARTLPKSWRKSPPPKAIQRIGDNWVAKQRTAVLKLPSAVVPTEWNYLLNPSHSSFGKIHIGPKVPVRFDPRLIKPDIHR